MAGCCLKKHSVSQIAHCLSWSPAYSEQLDGSWSPLSAWSPAGLAGLLMGFKHETLKMNPTQLLQGFQPWVWNNENKRTISSSFSSHITYQTWGISLFLSHYCFLLCSQLSTLLAPSPMLVMSEGVPTLFRSRTVSLCS